MAARNVGSSLFGTATPMRVGPPPPAACGAADETTSLGPNAASAEPANASEATVAPTSNARRRVLLI